MVLVFTDAQKADTTSFIILKLYACPVVSHIERLYKFHQQSFHKVCSFTKLRLAPKGITYILCLSLIGNIVDCTLSNWINYGDYNVCLSLYIIWNYHKRFCTQWDWDFCVKHPLKISNGLPLVTEFPKMFIAHTYRNTVLKYSIHCNSSVYKATCVHFSMKLVTHDM